MFDGLGFDAVLYFTGSLLIKIFGFGKYVTSITEEISDPFYAESMKRLANGKILVRADMVSLLGLVFWLGMVILALVGYWTGTFDVFSPLRNWLFGPST